MAVTRPHEDRLGTAGSSDTQVLTRTGTGIAEWAEPTGGSGTTVLGPVAIPEGGLSASGPTLEVGTLILKAWLIETSPYDEDAVSGDHVIVAVWSPDGMDIREANITRYDLWNQGFISQPLNALLPASDIQDFDGTATVYQREAVVTMEGQFAVSINVTDPSGVTYDLYALVVLP